MAIIDDAFLQDMAALGADLALKDDCEIKRDTSAGTPDGWNSGGNGTLTTIATVKCMKTVPSPALLQANADRLSTLTIWRVALPLGTDVQEQDVLAIKGESFKVEVKTQGSYDAFTNVLVSEVS
jgi:hypothetical protein